MAPKAIEMGLAHHVLLLVLVTTIICHETTAQSGCTRVLMSLSPCLNYITGNSSTPSSSCCSQLANVVQSQPLCLCSALNGGASSLGITVNQTQALSLPSACTVKTPPISSCNGGNGPSVDTATTPVSSPTTSPPADSSEDEPETPPPTSISTIPSGTGSKTVPTTQGSTSSGINVVNKPLHLTVFVLSAALSASLISGNI